MHSMTGYARRVTDAPRAHVVVEIRSVNHRFLKLSVGLPAGLGGLESGIARRVKERIVRGAVSLSVNLERPASEPGATIDTAALAGYHRQLAVALADLGIEGGVSADALVALPGVVVPSEPTTAELEALAPTVEAAVDAALDELLEMRAAEGAFLERELRSLTAEIRDQAAKVQARGPQSKAEYAARLQKRLAELTERPVALTEAELAREIAIYADKIDITEELTRMTSHLDQFEAALGRDGEIGRRLEFLTQELLRETNTVGSKNADAEIGAAVIELKTALERIREQLQNIE